MSLPPCGLGANTCSFGQDTCFLNLSLLLIFSINFYCSFQVSESDIGKLDAIMEPECETPSSTGSENPCLTPSSPIGDMQNVSLEENDHLVQEVTSPSHSFPDAPPSTPAAPTLEPTRSPSGVLQPTSCANSKPLIKIVSSEEILSRQAPTKLSPDRAPPRHGGRSGSRARADTLKDTMVYNEYGELVNAKTLQRQRSPADLSVIELLRVIKKAYRHEERVLYILLQDVFSQNTCFTDLD